MADSFGLPLTTYPVMDIQSNWDEVLRSSSRKKFWVSFREAGQRSKEIYLSKGSGGQIQGDPDGNLVVKDQSSYSVTITHVQSGGTSKFLRPRRSHAIHDKQLLCMDVSGSGELGVSSSEEGKLWVWETDTSESRRNLQGHVGDIYTCRFFPSGVVILSGGADLRLKIWSAEDGSCARTLIGHSRGITDTAIIDQGRNFISVSSDGKALLWDCGSAQCLATVATLTCEINSCSLAVNSSLVGNHASSLKEPECGTDDKLLLLACEDGQMRCYDVHNRNNVVTHSCGQSPLDCCEFLSPDIAVAGADDGTITMLDLRQPNVPVHRWSFCSSPVRSLLALSEDRCVAGFRDGSCIVWKYSSAQTSSSADGSSELTRLTGPENDPITCLRQSCGFTYSSCRDGTVRAYSIANM